MKTTTSRPEEQLLLRICRDFSIFFLDTRKSVCSMRPQQAAQRSNYVLGFAETCSTLENESTTKYIATKEAYMKIIH